MTRESSAILKDTSQADYEKALANAKEDFKKAKECLEELEARKPSYYDQVE
jgi:hypothetical protein